MTDAGATLERTGKGDDAAQRNRVSKEVMREDGRMGFAGTDKADGLKLQVRQLAKRYGTFVALHPIDFDMRNGEFLTLLGPSGSGKTTLLMSIAGLVEPDEGEVWLDGRIATYAPANKRGIGMVFQNYALFPHLSVFENVAFPLRMRSFSKAQIETSVRQALEAVRLPTHGDRLPSQLSGGQQQRVALARCLVYRPSIILMDEPLGALDKKLREHMQREIRQICTDLRVSVLYVTHDQEEAMVMSDRICLMNEGRIEQIGTPDDLYLCPRTVFTASFLGESNFLDGRITGEASKPVLELPLGRHVDGVDAPATAAIKVLVRPESIRLLEKNEDADVTYEATIFQIVPAGATTKLSLRLRDGSIVTAIVLTGQRSLPAADSRVRIGWSRRQMVPLFS